MNWGTKIVFGMIAFMLFIIAMVVYMFSVHSNDTLVDEDYYEKGINYDQEYTAMQNTQTDRASPVISVTKNQIIIKLKDSATYQLKLTRPSTVKNDVKMNGNTLSNSNLILIDRSAMPFGLWYLEINWVSNHKNYLLKTTITL